MEFVSGVVRGWSYSNAYSRARDDRRCRRAGDADVVLHRNRARDESVFGSKAPATPPFGQLPSVDVVPGTTTVMVDADGTLADTNEHGKITCRVVGGAAFARLVAAIGDGSALPPCPEPRRIVPLTYRAVYVRYGDVRRSCEWIASSGGNNDPPLLIDPRLSAIIDAVRL